MMSQARSLAAAGIAAIFLLSCENDRGTNEGSAIPSGAVGPEAVTPTGEGSWLNISGTVLSAAPSSFLLQTADGQLVVEMDDWDWYQEGRRLENGYHVAVTGRIDKDILKGRTIEARSVYVKELGTYYHASAADEESLEANTAYATPSPNYIDATGTVVAVGAGKLALGSPTGSITVVTSQIRANKTAGPPPTVEPGDRIYVWGDLEDESLLATGMIRLVEDRGTRTGWEN